MGQAAVDLPDSPEKAPAPLNSADDLLSRLAGAEIDRMLAASEQAVTVEPAPALDLPEASEATQPAKDAYAAEVDQLFKQLDKTTIQQPATMDAPIQTEAAPAVNVAANLPPNLAVDAVGDGAPPTPNNADSPKEAAASVESAPPSAPETPAAPETTLATAALPPAPAPLIRAAVPTPAPLAPPPAASAIPLPAPQPISVADAIESAVKQVQQQRAPLLVRVLEVINAPLARCPGVARDLLGKLAILTLMNALGVLLYVAIFRR